MGQQRGFLEFARAPTPQRSPRERVGDYHEVYEVPSAAHARQEAARCMDCGVPFCHDGCPLGNLIPDWNDLASRDDWRAAFDALDATNDFPEFTGRLCPAPCEPACVLAINDDPVAIKQVEVAIAERAWEEGWVQPRPPQRPTGQTVAVVGSGPAGLAVAAQLNRRGHEPTVFERDEAPGGLLRFGIPDFKLEKWVIDRRVTLLEREGVRFRCGVHCGVDLTGEQLLSSFSAVVLATGTRVPRDLAIPGRELHGVHFAMDYLYDCNRAVAVEQGRRASSGERAICAADRDVVVIGGGDTAMDCIANVHRQGAHSVTLLDTYEEPIGPAARDIVPWPAAPKRLPSTYALDEGGDRLDRRTAAELLGADGHVRAVRGIHVGPPPDRAPLAGSEFELAADLVLIAIGFAHPEHDGLISQLELELDQRGNVHAPVYATSKPSVFAAGDARRGKSLVVSAIAEGRRCARVVDQACQRHATGARTRRTSSARQRRPYANTRPRGAARARASR